MEGRLEVEIPMEKDGDYVSGDRIEATVMNVVWIATMLVYRKRYYDEGVQMEFQKFMEEKYLRALLMHL